MRVIFLGTPEFSIPSLDAIKNSKHELIAVITKPDRVQDRGKKIVFSPVKNYALEHNIPLYQYDKISRDGAEDIRALNPDIMVTASFGQILSQEIIDIPSYGIINVHASLLPHYRGASPIQTAIINGDTITGVTIMKTEAGLDTGDIIKARSIEIGEEETAGELSTRLSHLGAELLIEVLDEISEGIAEYTPQPHVDATVTKRIEKQEGRIVWGQSAKEIKCKILGFNPSPVAFTYLLDTPIKIYRARVAEGFGETNKTPGTILEGSTPKQGVFVQCGSGVIELLEVQFPSQKVIKATDALNGRKFVVGDILKFETELETKEPQILKK